MADATGVAALRARFSAAGDARPQAYALLFATGMLDSRAEMEVLAIALRATTDGIVILDPMGRIDFVNPALAQAWMQEESTLQGRSLSDFVSVAGDDGTLGGMLSTVMEQGRWTGEVRMRGLDAPRGVWDVTLTPIRGEDAVGSMATAARALIGIFRDVSDRHALEQLRADFLSMVTHDIRVPLTVILGYAEMLSDPEPPPGEVPPDVISRIRESGEKIYALVCNFLDLSRIEAGRFAVEPRPVDLRPLLVEALEHHGATARRKGIMLSFEAAPTVFATADAIQLGRAITNLLSNAIKYTAGGGRITIVADREDGWVALAFRDTGRGIPAEEIPHLFEKYRRVREAERSEGTGLGLFITKTIVEAHGGSIRVESTPGVGSTFTILLPAA